MARAVLVTGASGLLGREIFKAFNADKECWTTTGLAYSRIKDGLRKVDLTNSSQIKAVIQDVKVCKKTWCLSLLPIQV